MPPNDVQIIRALLEAGEDFVSGSQLADLIGVSRVSVWSYMEKLKEQGFDFEAIRSKGYRLIRKPDTLNQTLIQALFTETGASLKLFVLEETDSTNNEAERRLASRDETPFVVFAKQQSRGRGRMGRSWHSPQNGNIYGSFAFRPRISPARMSLFTLWMGLNLCECINAFSRVGSGVKWPNDLHINGKKVAGILTEARMEADQVRDVILGIGLNVNSDGSDWPSELKEIATSLRQASGARQDINRLSAAIAGRVMMAYQQFIDDQHRSLLKQKWKNYDILQGKTVSLLQGDSRISGTATGIDATGSLLIERENGTRFHARAGEVTIEKL